MELRSRNDASKTKATRDQPGDTAVHLRKGARYPRHMLALGSQLACERAGNGEGL